LQTQINKVIFHRFNLKIPGLKNKKGNQMKKFNKKAKRILLGVTAIISLVNIEAVKS